jgi:hypothetical protein
VLKSSARRELKNDINPHSPDEAVRGGADLD